ncbi:hypothetical protein R3P38DRAFT_1404345 [Favolaschia claudopus]|uniref:G-protein coupled receptors family 3 profile domain-containing protein n=1 Tax=Favolaschia claudopus TaxID=2862362 RepID=A0AAW0AT53_9AGAR
MRGANSPSSFPACQCSGLIMDSFTMPDLDDSSQASGEGAPDSGLNGGIVVFDFILILAFVLLILILIPALFSSTVVRIKSWFAVVMTSLLCCVSFLLLLGQQTGAEPNLPICLLSASLIYAGPPLVACSGVLLVVELYLRLRSTILSKTVNETLVSLMLWVLPIVHALSSWVTLLTGLSDISSIRRDPTGLYCHVEHPGPTLTTGVLVAVFQVLMFIFEGLSIRLLVKKRMSIRHVRINSRDFPSSLFFRTAMYTFIGGLVVITVLIMNTTSTTRSIGSYIMVNLLAIMPLLVAVVFGTQQEILNWYRCWKPRYRYPMTHAPQAKP